MRALLVSLALSLALAAAAVPADAAAPKSPRLASLQIEIWPEYDRPKNLVILKGELTPDTALPAAVTVRIPAAAGGPSAVAYIDETGNLLNLNYEKQDAGAFTLVRLTSPQRAFHVEFYEPLVASDAEREYRYTWPGDLAVQRLGVLVKEPAAATNITVSPELGIVGASPDGLKYRAGEFGALKSGEHMVVAVRYTKTDPRSTAEILGRGDKSAQPREEGRPLWPFALIAAGLILGASVLFLLSRRRKPTVACRKCGRALEADARFCAGCGAAIKK